MYMYMWSTCTCMYRPFYSIHVYADSSQTAKQHHRSFTPFRFILVHVCVTIATVANLSNRSEEVWNELRGEKLSQNLVAVVALRRLAFWYLCHVLSAFSLLSWCAKEILDEDGAD